MESYPQPPPEIEPDERTFTPPEVRYRMLSLVWCFPSLGALWLLGTGMQSWKFEGGMLGALARVRLEEWIAVLLLGLHVLWLTQWWRANRRH